MVNISPSSLSKVKFQGTSKRIEEPQTMSFCGTKGDTVTFSGKNRLIMYL